MILGADAVARPEVQPADPEVSAREQGTHFEISRQRDRRQVLVLGLFDVDGAARAGVTEHP